MAFRNGSLSYLFISIAGFLQYELLLIFFRLIDPIYFGDLGAYQSLIESMAGEGLRLDMFSYDAIQERTLAYHEYFSSLIFEVAAYYRLSAIELHSLTIAVISIVTSTLQLKLAPKKSLALLLTLSCPFIFSNLFLGNTRQLWGCTLILFFYWKTPLFQFFSPQKFGLGWRFIKVFTFSLLIIMTHMGSVVVFATILLVDFIVSRLNRLHLPSLSVNKLAAISAFSLLGAAFFYLIFDSPVYEVLDAKASYYLLEDIPAYPYLTGIFTYLVIAPLVIDCFLIERKFSPLEELRRILLLALLLLSISLVLPISFSHIIDRVLTALFFFLYIKRLDIGSLGFEFMVFIPVRIFALFLYMLTRAI